MIVQILGDSWTIEVVSDEKHFNYHVADGDKETEALTDPDLSTIYFKKSKLNIVNIRHELLHAYIIMCCAYHSDIDKSSFEEIVCDIYGKYGSKMNVQANEILAKLTEKSDDE